MLPKSRFSKPIFRQPAGSTKLDRPYCKRFWKKTLFFVGNATTIEFWKCKFLIVEKFCCHCAGSYFLATPLPLFWASSCPIPPPRKNALFCRAKGTTRSLERGSFRMDLSTNFGKEIPSRNLREKRSVVIFVRLKFRYRPKGVLGRGVGNNKIGLTLCHKCVRNASEKRQKCTNMCLVLLGKEGRSKMRQK